MKLKLSIGMAANPRTGPIFDGRVQAEGIELLPSEVFPSELFWRQLKFGDFDIAEMSMSTLMMALAAGEERFVGIPVFTTRKLFHTEIVVRRDAGIERPADLKGKRVGVPEYQMSAVMWFRGFLHDEFGIAAKDMNWIQGGLENPGRREKFPLNLPPGFPLGFAPDGQSLSQMLADGALDVVMAARRPSCFVAGHPKVARLYPDYRGAERDYFRKTGIFPIMHAVGVRRDVLEKHPWLAQSIYKAFAQAKLMADAEFAETTALKIGLPWVNAEYDDTRALMGDDFWSYGLNDANRNTLNAMARYSYEQGLAVRLLTVEEMFAESTIDGETRV